MERREIIGYVGLPGLGKNVVEKWIHALKTIIDDPAAAAVLEKFQVDPAFLGGDDYKRFVMDEARAVRPVPVSKEK